MLSLSLIIPTFNRCDMLRDAIASALGQSPAIDELILVDDASTDETESLCQALQTKQSRTRLIYLRNDCNRGAQVSRNRGFAAATGDAVMFLDSDDVLAPDGVRSLRAALEAEPRLDYVYGTSIKAGSDLKPLPGSVSTGGPFGPEPVDVAGYHWETPAALYRRGYLAQIGPWNEELTGAQDWEFQARVKLGGGYWRFIDHTVALCRQHTGRRVGTSKFRPDYVRSVELACLSISRHAAAAGMLDLALRRRLARKLCLHALEFSLNGFARDKNRLMEEATQLAGDDSLYTALLRILRPAPRMVDMWLWSARQWLITRQVTLYAERQKS
jgi:glycosyltransferase involved in cell wall biosynthesis